MKTVLVIDDNPETLICLEEMLHLLGYEVISCRNGQSALLMVHEQRRVDLIITDYRMPGMTGLEFIAELKKLSAQIPVILASAHLRADVFSKAMALGAAEYLQKPVNPYDLKQVIARALSGASLQSAELPANG